MRRNAVGDIVIELRADGSDRSGDGEWRIKVHEKFVVIRSRVWILTDGAVDLRKDGMKALWDICGLNITSDA